MWSLHFIRGTRQFIHITGQKVGVGAVKTKSQERRTGSSGRLFQVEGRVRQSNPATTWMGRLFQAKDTAKAEVQRCDYTSFEEFQRASEGVGGRARSFIYPVHSLSV